MRFLMLMMPKGYGNAEPGAQPDPAKVAAMSAYNQSLADAGVLLALDGLHPPVEGARVSFSTGTPRVTHGPFPGVEEVVGGYWIIKTGSKAEAIDWALRCPASDNETIEVRRIFDFEDYSPEVQQAASSPA
jgi:hypothetical protein